MEIKIEQFMLEQIVEEKTKEEVKELEKAEGRRLEKEGRKEEELAYPGRRSRRRSGAKGGRPTARFVSSDVFYWQWR